MSTIRKAYVDPKSPCPVCKAVLLDGVPLAGPRSETASEYLFGSLNKVSIGGTAILLVHGFELHG